MAERLFLCGLSAAQQARYAAGRALHLHGPKANVRLHLDDLRGGLLEIEPELLTDLIEIAVYVFAADCAISRGGPALKEMGAQWRRQFRLVIAVRQPGSWAAPQRLHALREALQFLTEDCWTFEFVELENPPSIQEYLGFSDGDAVKTDGSTIVLFSGGLNSFAGAVTELSSGNQHVVLLSRRLGGMTDQRQIELAHELKVRYPKRVTHVQVHAGLTLETKAHEHTQRTRTFLLISMAIIAAFMEHSDRVRVYENGIMSINLPISTQVVGARASRSTHPRSLMLLEALVRLVGESDVRIENPFIWKTKVEVVQELKNRPEGQLIGHTLSCSRTRDMTHYKPHCGKCAQCLQRRISTLGAEASDADPAEGYAVDLLLGPRQAGEDRAMAVDMIRSALEFRRLSDADFATRYASEFAWLTSGFSDQEPSKVVRRSIDMFRRHGEVVRSIFKQAASDHAGNLIDHILPDSCLLQIVISVPGAELDQDFIGSGSQPDVNEATADEAIADSDQVVLAVDNAQKRILIEGIGPLTSPAEYRIVSVLANLFREDRETERAPENFRTLSAAKLAEMVSSGGDQVARKAIARVREKISQEHQELYGIALALDAVIENVRGKGYRINPSVRIVSPDQLRRG